MYTAYFYCVEFESERYIRDCTESKFGCCDDLLTFAPGPNKAGCPGNVT